jgi:endonuclease I
VHAEGVGCVVLQVRYDGTEASTTDLELSDTPDAANSMMGVLSTLLAWHAADPVSASERARNERICTDYSTTATHS